MALIEAFCDGASRGQGARKDGRIQRKGEAAAACCIYKNGRKIAEYARPLGIRTNNEAEYEAVIMALLICSMGNFSDPIIYSDSSVVVNQVSGKWKCTNKKLIPLLMSVQIIQEDFRFRILQVPRNFRVDKRGIFEADSLAKECLDRLQERL